MTFNKLALIALLSFQLVSSADKNPDGCKQPSDVKAARKAAKEKYEKCLFICDNKLSTEYSFYKENVTPPRNRWALEKFHACNKKCLALYLRRLDAINKRFAPKPNEQLNVSNSTSTNILPNSER